ncbi:hypothetical protein HDV01_001904 [Terramyces sp. JEL0728]|nr:hypothetical protein HDV01_001904 [Terramyces sp. JEL0728]
MAKNITGLNPGVTPSCSTGFSLVSMNGQCQNRFFCPNIEANNPVTTICLPDAVCDARRIVGALCDTQGTFEPFPCPRGFYCINDGTEKVACPDGSWCPLGTINPIPCNAFSNCPKGSNAQRYYGSMLLAGFIDATLLIVVALMYLAEFVRVYNNRRRLNPDLPESSIAKMAGNFSLSRTSTKKNNAFQDKSILEAFTESRNGSSTTIRLKFEDLTLKLSNGVSVLQSITGEISPGKFTAILGPSGAGKTSFLNVLCGKVAKTKGQLYINDVEGSLSNFKKIIGFVPQEDIMHRELTVRQNIYHSARIRAPNEWSDQKVSNYVNALIRALNLTEVCDTQIGNEINRGISGGQRKRVNIGMELAGLPLAVFLDEPTSGLDSTSSLNVAVLLKNMSSLGLTTVAVLHQPRQEIYDEIDDILLMVPGGKTAYLGPRESAQQYFENLGYKFSKNKNPCDILMDIVSEQAKRYVGGGPLSCNQLADEWEYFVEHGKNSNNYQKDEAYHMDQERFENQSDYNAMIDPRLHKSRDPRRASNQYPRSSKIAPYDTADPNGYNYQYYSQYDQQYAQPYQRKPLPQLYETIQRTRSKKPPPVEIQKSSQQELLVLCRQRNTSFITQFSLCFSRAFMQQYRNFGDLVWEITVSTIIGFFLGNSMNSLSGQLYRGIFVQPLSLLSPAPNETAVTQTSLIFALAICLAAAPSGVNIFGPEIVVYYREASNGHSKAAYYLAKTLSGIPRILLSSLHMISIWYYFASPLTSFTNMYLAIMLSYFGVYGIASIMSMLVKRESQSVLSTLASFIPAIFCGNAPTIADNPNFLQLFFALSYNRWATEIFYSGELGPFRGFYDIDRSVSLFGYTLGREGFDMCIMIIIGVVLRIIGFLCLVGWNRQKQK